MSARRGSGRRLRPAREQPPTLVEVVDAFLAQPDLAVSSRRSYAQTLGRVQRELGPERPLQWVSGRELEQAVIEAWGRCAPATWNRHLATVRSFPAYCSRQGWVSEPLADMLARRREPADRTRAIPLAQLERPWRRDDVAVREKALWQLLYETAARASEVLSLNVEDLELENKRARVRSKGGDVEWLHLQAGSARLLPRVIAGRSRGPLFLSDRRPAPARMPATADVCPVTWRARLSYRRAEELFSTASGGWTLHQLRHSAITHLAEADVGLALLMAKSRHTSLRSLQRYARPGSEAVAAQPGTPADLGAALRANHRPGHASPPPRAIRSVRHRLRVQAVRDQHPAVVLHPGRGRAHGRRAAPGPVGGRIVSETLIGLLRADPTSYLSAHPRFKPFLGADLRLGPMVNPNLTGNRAYTHAHVLHYAGVVTPATYR